VKRPELSGSYRGQQTSSRLLTDRLTSADGRRETTGSRIVRWSEGSQRTLAAKRPVRGSYALPTFVRTRSNITGICVWSLIASGHYRKVPKMTWSLLVSLYGPWLCGCLSKVRWFKKTVDLFVFGTLSLGVSKITRGLPVCDLWFRKRSVEVIVVRSYPGVVFDARFYRSNVINWPEMSRFFLAVFHDACGRRLKVQWSQLTSSGHSWPGGRWVFLCVCVVLDRSDVVRETHEERHSCVVLCRGSCGHPSPPLGMEPLLRTNNH